MFDPSVRPEPRAKKTTRKHIPESVLDLARKIVADGKGWNAAGRATGFSEGTIRSRLDPEYEKHRRAGIRAARQRRLTREEAEGAVMFRVPTDTRSRMARFFGDPPPGRSALDQRGHR